MCCFSANTYSSIWSPAAIAPVSDLMSGNSCMQRAAAAYHHHPMASAPQTNASCYPPQSYGPASAYYSNMDYHMSGMPHHTQLGAVTTMASALNQMNSSNMSSHMNPIMSSHGHHGASARSPPINGGIPSPNDCLEYNPDTKAGNWKFQVL